MEVSADSQTAAVPAAPADEGATVSYAILDQALWRNFRAAEGPEAFVTNWLALQCRNVPGATAGVVVLGEPDVGPYAPAAFWPDQETVGTSLAFVAEKALAQRQGVVFNGDGDRAPAAAFAHPLIVEGRLYGVCAIAAPVDRRQANDVMRRLQWGAGWIEVLLRRQMQAGLEEQRERNAAAFDLLATVLEHDRIGAAAKALVTELAMRLGCDPVSIGFVRRRRCVVAAVSHAASFGRRMSLVRDTEAAMDEAIDQKAIVLFPERPGWDYRVSRAHRDLAHMHRAGAVLTVPLQANGRITGALTLERRQGEEFDEATVELCDAVAAVVGPVLAEKKKNDRLLVRKVWDSFAAQLKRLLGPGYFGRKLATVIVVALAVFLATARSPYVVTAPAILEGSIQRSIVAPFNGFIAGENARAGSTVKAGDVLARLDDQELSLERRRLEAAMQQRMTERNRALAAGERAEAMIIATQIGQAEAQLALIDEQLARTRLVAPFDGFVVDGDLSQSIGASVQRGDELFRIAPLDSYRVVLEVDESDIDSIAVGQTGTMRLTAMPEAPMTYRVERITAIAAQKEGRNFFRVEAALDGAGDHLRPGMEGVSKTEIDERALIQVYGGRLFDWARLTVWRWLP